MKTTEKLRQATMKAKQSSQKFKAGMEELKRLQTEQEAILKRMGEGLNQAHSLAKEIEKQSQEINDLY